jgi:sugar phosphate isomerase/epimerase
MTLAYGAQPRLLTTGLNINDLNEEGRQNAVKTLKEGIDEAYESGAESFAFLSGNYTEETKEESFAALVKSTGELCRYAEDRGDLRIALEIFDFDIDKKSLIGPVSIAKRFAKKMRDDYKNFGLLVDLSHLPLLRETPKEAILPIKDYIVHVHIGNAVVKNPGFEAYGDAHPRFGFPDSANDVTELVEFLRVLLEIGYLNKTNPPVVSFEVKPWKDEDPDIVIANSKRTLNEAWARV